MIPIFTSFFGLRTLAVIFFHFVLYYCPGQYLLVQKYQKLFVILLCQSCMVMLVFRHTHFRDGDPRGERFWIHVGIYRLTLHVCVYVCLYVCQSICPSCTSLFFLHTHFRDVDPRGERFGSVRVYSLLHVCLCM